jgi:hypothetical protein
VGRTGAPHWYCQIGRGGRAQRAHTAYCSNEPNRISLSSTSISCRNYQSLRLVVFRFALRFRDVEEMLARRGVTLSYETILKVDQIGHNAKAARCVGRCKLLIYLVAGGGIEPPTLGL